MRWMLGRVMLTLAACGQEAPTQDSFAPSVGTGTADASTTSEVSTRLAIEFAGQNPS